MPLFGGNEIQSCFDNRVAVLFKFDDGGIDLVLVDRENELDVSLVKGAFARGADDVHRFVDQIQVRQRSN